MSPGEQSIIGHDNTVTRLWPEAGETEDRILSQMSNNRSSGKTRTILVFNGVKSTETDKQKFIAHKCPITDCILTGDHNVASSADAILFEGRISEPSRYLHNTRPRDQLWVLYFLESPYHTMGLKGYYGKVNYTATYRRDSTLVTPYERWVQFRNVSELPDRAPRNFALGKTKKVAWFVSNCGDRNGRLAYAKELQKYINVDIYGHCGDKSCQRGNSQCTLMLKNDYKFYLAFENSNCQDYITEKLYWNAYQ
jgi:glycoprotein 3-alpha-L-fucosyltransferase